MKKSHDQTENLRVILDIFLSPLSFRRERQSVLFAPALRSSFALHTSVQALVTFAWTIIVVSVCGIPMFNIFFHLSWAMEL